MEEGRSVPISPALREVLESIRQEVCAGKGTPIDGRVFTWKGKPMSEGWRTAFLANCRRVRLTDLRFHDLRHMFVTRKVWEEWDYKQIVTFTGHKTFAIFQRYNNPSEEHIKTVVLAGFPRKVVREETWCCQTIVERIYLPTAGAAKCLISLYAPVAQ